jgi:hypothetical protein
MNRRTFIVVIVALLGSWLAPVTDAVAQSQTTFDQLSPTDQKIARALFEAQAPKTALALDEIAALKKSGLSWGEIFSDFLVRDLVTDKKLGQLLKQYRAELEQTGRTSAGR